VKLERLRVSCQELSCPNHDAVVFVHGINGSEETFKTDSFDWPRNFPTQIANRTIDVYRIDYKSSLLSRAQQRNPLFDDVVEDVVHALAPVRRKGYRSIGFIAHSLGGNIVASYLQSVKAEFGHAQRSQHAFVIALGTPRSGANIASIASHLQNFLLIRNDLLESLKEDNIYLRMLRLLGEKTDGKSVRFGCRPVLLYVGYEKVRVPGVLVVSERSAVGPSTANAARDVEGFDVDHFQIAKPTSLDHPIHQFVKRSMEDAFDMVAKWPADTNKLCEQAPYVEERLGVDLTTYPARDYLRPKRDLD
jgi:hypothetical protein